MEISPSFGKFFLLIVAQRFRCSDVCLEAVQCMLWDLLPFTTELSPGCLGVDSLLIVSNTLEGYERRDVHLLLYRQWPT